MLPFFGFVVVKTIKKKSKKKRGRRRRKKKKKKKKEKTNELRGKGTKRRRRRRSRRDGMREGGREGRRGGGKCLCFYNNPKLIRVKYTKQHLGNDELKKKKKGLDLTLKDLLELGEAPCTSIC